LVGDKLSRKGRLEKLTVYARQLLQDKEMYNLMDWHARLNKYMIKTWSLSESTRRDYIKDLHIILAKEIEGLEEEPSISLGIFGSKPQIEISRLKLFADVFTALSGEDRDDVPEQSLINALFKTGRFTRDEISNYIKKECQNGSIYERRPGFYQRA
jgi:hypothetical protein